MHNRVVTLSCFFNPAAMIVPDLLSRLYSLVVDRRCMVCDAPLDPGRYCVCRQCEEEGVFDNPRLKFKGNVLEERMYGLTSCKAAAALMPYGENNGSRTMIHRLKYNNNYNVAVQIGEAMASRIQKSERFGRIDWVVPVPLHPERLRKRGYNQSEMVAETVSRVLRATLDTDNLYRTRNNSSQTSRRRIDRITDTQGLFAIRDANRFANSGVLLIDDVFTTGSTIIECCKALDQTPGIELYVYTIAAGG